MRTSTGILSLALTVPALLSCGEEQSAVNVDPELGRACFEALLPSLPNGTQYEGIEGATEERLTIRVMTGVAVTTVECPLNADGTLGPAGD